MLQNKIVRVVVSFVLYISIFIPVLKSNNLMEARDDYLILSPLQNVSSISDFWKVHFQSNKYDIFPIVDLTYLIDLKLQKLDFFTFHISNLIYWILCLYAFFCLLKKTFPKMRGLYYFLFILFALHPINFMVVSWVSGRKHIIGFLFFILGLQLFQKWSKSKSMKTYTLFSLNYVAIICSHLLYTLLPFALLIREIFSKESVKTRNLIYLLPHLILCLAWNGYNYFRYIEIFQINQQFHNIEWLSLSFQPDFIKVISMTGKYVYRIFIPFFSAVSYEALGISSVIGLVFLLLLSWLSVKKKELAAYIFFLFPIIFVVWKVSIVALDTYLLWPLFAFVILLGQILKKYNLTTKMYRNLSLVVIFLYAPTNFKITEAWSSDYKLQKMTYENEGACYQIRDFARELLVENRIEELIELGQEYFLIQCQLQEPVAHEVVKEFLIFYDPKFTFDKKLNYFKTRPQNPDDKLLFISALYLFHNKPKEAFKILRELNLPFRAIVGSGENTYRKSIAKLFFQHFCLDNSCVQLINEGKESQ